jgi:hypothetical protein
MAGKIHFTSGKTVDLTEHEFRRIAPQMQERGIRLVKLQNGWYVPVNSNSMEFIEYIPEELEIDKEDKAIKESGVTADVVEKTAEEIKKEESITERKKKALEEMMTKSNCMHEAEKLELYVQQTAKGVRYFPVCSFCGKRERYVSEKKILDGQYAGTPNEKWTAEDLETAIPYVEE